MSTVTITGKLHSSDNPVALKGTVKVPSSKSHTIRALLIASLAKGSSRIRNALFSSDTASCVKACRKLGAVIQEREDGWEVLSPISTGKGDDVFIDVGNSGTSLYLLTAIAATLDRKVHFDGDDQIRSRSAASLLNALKELGAEIESSENGCAPFWVKGPLKGGSCSIECPTSQYLSALLLAAPLLSSEKSQCRIEVPLLMEQPYAEMTLQWLETQKIKLQRNEMKEFLIPGGQHYRPFDSSIAADFSSATFFFCAAALSASTLIIKGLDMNDSQGDKAVLDYLSSMGARVIHSDEGIEISAGPLKGVVLDLNDTPDALPAMAVTACYAAGETRIVNVPQARMKETDRISVMTAELRKMGAVIEETADGMIIQGSPLTGCTVNGHGDHRIVMALAIASLGAHGKTTIDTAEAVDITYPGFFEQLELLKKELQ